MTTAEWQIYNKVKMELRIEDAEWRVREYLEQNELPAELIEEFDFDEMAEQFEERYETNVSEETVWEWVIEDAVEDIEE